MGAANTCLIRSPAMPHGCGGQMRSVNVISLAQRAARQCVEANHALVLIDDFPNLVLLDVFGVGKNNGFTYQPYCDQLNAQHYK